MDSYRIRTTCIEWIMTVICKWIVTEFYRIPCCILFAGQRAYTEVISSMYALAIIERIYLIFPEQPVGWRTIICSTCRQTDMTYTHA